MEAPSSLSHGRGCQRSSYGAKEEAGSRVMREESGRFHLSRDRRLLLGSCWLAVW